jgi:low temperature requirement protein LtrA
MVFVASVFVDAPGRYWMWATGLLIEVLGQVIAFRRWSPPGHQPGDPVIGVTPSLVERLGLLMIIVLGEVIVGAVNGMADIEVLGGGGIVIGLLGVLVAIGLWWIYFDLVSHREPIASRSQLWLHLHLPLAMAIAAGGAGVLNTVEHADLLPDEVRWLLVGSLAVAIVVVAALTRTIEARRATPRTYRTAEIALVTSTLLVLVVGLTGWGARATLGSMVILLLVPVVVALLVWRKQTPASER